MKNSELLPAIGKLLPTFIILATVGTLFGYFILGIRDESLARIVAVPLMISFVLSRVIISVVTPEEDEGVEVCSTPQQPTSLQQRTFSLVIAVIVCLFSWSSVVLLLSSGVYLAFGMHRASLVAVTLSLDSLVADSIVFLFFIGIGLVKRTQADVWLNSLGNGVFLVHWLGFSVPTKIFDSLRDSWHRLRGLPLIPRHAHSSTIVVGVGLPRHAHPRTYGRRQQYDVSGPSPSPARKPSVK